MTPQHPTPNSAPCPTDMQTRHTGPPNTEKRDPGDQNEKDLARFRRVELFLLQHPQRFATQGSVAATWRTYRGRRLGPYFQLIYRRDGRKRSHSFHRILMRSAAKLAYAQAQAAIDGRPDDTTGPLLDPILRPLYAAYACAKRARDERDPLNLDLPERKILLKSDGTVAA